MIANGCQAAGFCVLVAGAIYCPNAARIADPVVMVASDLLGEAILSDVRSHYFENFGTAEYVVPQSLPDAPQLSNQLCIRSRADYVPAVLRIYGSSRDDVALQTADQLLASR